MKKFILLLVISNITQLTSQEVLLSPKNNPADINLLKSGISKMSWFMIQDSVEIKIGDVQTEIQKEKDLIYIITTTNIKQSPTKWIDSTIVRTSNFESVYHSSFNQQRDMVLKFGKKIKGYYLDKRTNAKVEIDEEINSSFFDSNFYPQFIRLLPLKEDYSKTIAIFDYNPKSKIGILTATLKNVKKATTTIENKKKEVWKVETTDDISDNSTTVIYYLDVITRQIIKQEIDIGGRKMIMRLMK